MNKTQTKIILVLGIVLIIGLFFWGWSIYQEKKIRPQSILDKNEIFKEMLKECSKEYLGYVQSGIYRATEGTCFARVEDVNNGKWLKNFVFNSEPFAVINKDKVNIVYLDLTRIISRFSSPYESPRIFIKANTSFNPVSTSVIWIPQDPNDTLSATGVNPKLLKNMQIMKDQGLIIIGLSEELINRALYYKGNLIAGFVIIPSLNQNKTPEKTIKFEVLSVPSPETPLNITPIGQNNIIKYSTLTNIMYNIAKEFYTPPVIYKVSLPIK